MRQMDIEDLHVYPLIIGSSTIIVVNGAFVPIEPYSVSVKNPGNI